MIKKTACAVLVPAAVLFLAAGALGGEEKDIILFKDHTEKKVDKVTEENYAHVKYINAGRTEQVKASDVEDVTYASAPQTFQNARGLMNSKKYEEAIESFKKAADASSADWIKPYTLYYRAHCHRKLGLREPSHYEEAAELYGTLLKEFPHTRFLAPALYYRGQALTQAEQYQEADKTFTRLTTEVSDKALEERWAHLGLVAQAHVKEAQGYYDEAFYKYESIYNTTRSTHPSVANKALLRKGLCLIKQKKFSQAKTYFQDLFRSASGEDIQAREIKAGAAIGLGHCFLNDDNVREARHWFLKAMVLYFSEEFTPEAMYYAGLCYEKLEKREGGAKKRAKIIFSDLLIRFPNSQWAAKAKEKNYQVLPE